MERAFLSLMLDLTVDAPEGAGWYVVAGTEAGRLVGPTAIASELAEQIAATCSGALVASGTEAKVASTVPELVESGNLLIQSALEKQLRFAEEQAAKIATLRRKLSATMKSNEQ